MLNCEAALRVLVQKERLQNGVCSTVCSLVFIEIPRLLGRPNSRLEFLWSGCGALSLIAFLVVDGVVGYTLIAIRPGHF